MDYTYHFRSPIGGITMASDGEALTGLWFDGQKYFADTLSEQHEVKELEVFKQAERWLAMYFNGNIPDFTPKLHMRMTAFQKEVWDILLTIPLGRTMTYGEIAGILATRHGIQSKPAQAVGGAVGRNAISLIIPCHRVVGAHGELTGYAGGIEKKEWLLKHEAQMIRHVQISQ